MRQCEKIMRQKRRNPQGPIWWSRSCRRGDGPRSGPRITILSQKGRCPSGDEPHSKTEYSADSENSLNLGLQFLLISHVEIVNF